MEKQTETLCFIIFRDSEIFYYHFFVRVPAWKWACPFSWYKATCLPNIMIGTAVKPWNGNKKSIIRICINSKDYSGDLCWLAREREMSSKISCKKLKVDSSNIGTNKWFHSLVELGVDKLRKTRYLPNNVTIYYLHYSSLYKNLSSQNNQW